MNAFIRARETMRSNFSNQFLLDVCQRDMCIGHDPHNYVGMQFGVCHMRVVDIYRARLMKGELNRRST